MLNNSLRESYIDDSPFLLGNSVSLEMLAQFPCVKEYLKTKHQMEAIFLFIRLELLVENQTLILVENCLKNIRKNFLILMREIFFCLHQEQSVELLNILEKTLIFKIQILYGCRMINLFATSF